MAPIYNMEVTKKQHTPIKFNLEYSDKDYHLIDRSELHKMDNQTIKKRIDELNMRVVHARKYYRGRYDERHRRWMQTLAQPMKTHHKVNLSLDAIIAVGY